MIKKYLPLLIILLIGGYFRFTGLNWDQGNHLHPDERFLVMVGTAMKWPENISTYLDTASSLLNPHNIGYDFYVYGTLPIILVKIIGTLTGTDTYDKLLITGRVVTAAVDFTSILLVYWLAKRLSKSNTLSLLAAFIYATSALPIQLAHFFAVDPFLVFFILLSLIFSTYKSKSSSALSGLAFAAALSSKISGVLFLPMLIFSLLYFTRRISSLLFFSLPALIGIRLFYPYLFSSADLITDLNQKVLANWKQLETFNDPSGWFPPAVQWINVPKYIFPLQNMFFWGLGVPLALLAISSLIVSLLNIKKATWLITPLLGIFTLFVYQGWKFAPAMRYFYPLYPLLAILVGFMLSQLKTKTIAYYLILIALLLWPISVNQIYTRPHTRVSATNWIIQNIPVGSRISCEHWDDCLPLGGPLGYQLVELPLYNPDSLEKTADLTSKLASLDYILLSSNRLYGSISSVPDKYPLTSQFYADLFQGRTEFKKVSEFTSRPTLPIPFTSKCVRFPFSGKYGDVSNSDSCTTTGISFIDDYADETWTVYDHPKVTIFKRVMQ